MGRKVHPIGFRLNVTRDWRGRWFAEGAQYREQLSQDFAIRDMLYAESGRAGVSRIDVERYPGKYAAMIFELILGEGGFYAGSREFFLALMEIFFPSFSAITPTTSPLSFLRISLAGVPVLPSDALPAGSAPSAGDHREPCASNSYQIPNTLLAGQTWYWRIRPINSEGFPGPWSKTWTFNVK